MAATIGTGRTTCFGCVNSFAPKDQCSLDTQLDVTNKRSTEVQLLLLLLVFCILRAQTVGRPVGAYSSSIHQ